MHQLDDLIIQAIRQKRLVRFDYDGRSRLVEPHAFGVRGEKRILEAYQTDGIHRVLSQGGGTSRQIASPRSSCWTTTFRDGPISQWVRIAGTASLSVHNKELREKTRQR